jgi:hypothetical protein
MLTEQASTEQEVAELARELGIPEDFIIGDRELNQEELQLAVGKLRKAWVELTDNAKVEKRTGDFEDDTQNFPGSHWKTKLFHVGEDTLRRDLHSFEAPKGLDRRRVASLHDSVKFSQYFGITQSSGRYVLMSDQPGSVEFGIVFSEERTGEEPIYSHHRTSTVRKAIGFYSAFKKALQPKLPK